jgi:hypothetical protein
MTDGLLAKVIVAGVVVALVATPFIAFAALVVALAR